MTYLAIDLGDKRVGTAVSQENFAFARDIVPRTEIISYIKKTLSEDLSIQTIIVGLPYDLYGIDTKQLDKTKKFIEKLKNIFPKVSIIGHDERFSSFSASDGFSDHRDDIAAQCILQSYLDTKNK